MRLTALQVAATALALFILCFAVFLHRQRRRIQALRERRDRLTEILDSVSAWVMVVDPKGFVGYASPRWRPHAEHDARTSSAAACRPDVDSYLRALNIVASAHHARAAIDAVLSGRCAHQAIDFPCAPDEVSASPVTWMSMRVETLRTAQGEALVALVDVTNWRQIFAALQASERRLNRAMVAGRVGEWESDLATGRIWSSANLHQLIGLPDGTITSYDTFLKVLHPEDRERDGQLRDAFAEAGGYRESQLRFVRPDGTVMWGECRGEVLPDREGLVVGVTVDVTARMEAEAHLRQALADVQRLRDQLQAENVYLKDELSASYRLGEFVFHSKGMRTVLELVTDVARTSTPVLITGETGTGKEVVARVIHDKSDRRERPYVRVNCSALPPALIESELFGHERGAFTGATDRRIGRFELADGGTLLLDEIGELPLELQPKLLRVLQDGEFERVGGSTTIRTSARILAATNRDLSAAVREGTFRADLLYRLHVFPVHVPPLRERVEDIGPLTTIALERATKRLGRTCDGLPQRMLSALEAYSWPGNVRELQNVIERAVLLSRGGRLRLPENWDDSTTASSPPSVDREPVSPAISEADDLVNLEEFSRRHITHALERARWRIGGSRGAAALLAINPSTLRSRMSKLGIRAASSRG